jgi:AICAR transformylase/IMP cyclohydrolase PurH
VSRDIKELDGRVKTLTEYIIEGKLHKKKKTCTMKKSMKNKNTNGRWPSF